MASYGGGFLAWLDDPLVKKVRRIGAGILFLAALALSFFAIKYERHHVLQSDPVSEWAGKLFSRVWATDSGELIGMRVQGADLVFESSRALMGWNQVAIPGAAKSAMSYDSTANRLAWLQGGTLYSGLLDFAGGQLIDRKTLPAAGRRLAQFSVSARSHLNLVWSDGRLGTWDPATNNVSAIPGQVDTRFIHLDGDYMVALEGQEATVYRVGGVDRLNVVERTPNPPSNMSLQLVRTGRFVAISVGGIWDRNGTINSPGKVISVGLGPEGELLAGGDFDGVFHLTRERVPFRVAPMPGVTAIGASANFLATSGPEGAALRKFRSELVMTPRGQSIMWLVWVLLALAAVAALVTFVWQLVGAIFSAAWGRKKKLPRMLQAPDTLAGVFLSGNAVLWSGAGVGAQSGFPTRRSYIEMALDAAADEQWLDVKSVKEIRGIFNSGRSEEALDTLVRRLGQAKNELFAVMRMLFVRIAAQSRSHRAIARLPWCAAITTGYDEVLDVLGPKWTSMGMTMRTPPGKLPMPGTFFLCKLYGDLRIPDTVLFSRKEFEQEIPAAPKVVEIIHDLFREKTMIFIGASVAGVLHDLEKLGVPKKVHRAHYLITGATGTVWIDQARRLKDDYGIHAIVCDEDVVAEEMSKCLERLAAQVEEARSKGSAAIRIGTLEDQTSRLTSPRTVV